MNQTMNAAVLGQENLAFRGKGGVSQENRSSGFRPAFLDAETGEVFASCYAGGQPAPFHLLDGLPEKLVLARNAGGRVAEVKSSVTSGFVRDGRFYTRDQAARAVTSLH
jgi:hypothetical protein